MSARAQRRFNLGSTVFVAFIALGWSWSLATARAIVNLPETDRPVLSRVTAKVGTALTSRHAPSAAYVTDALLEALMPLRGYSGRLQAVIGEEGQPIFPDTLIEGAQVTWTAEGRVETVPGGRPPQAAGVWDVVIRFGNVVKPVTDLRVITLRPAADQRQGRIGLYFIGNWPAAARGRPSYAPPRGFIEVTRENQDTPVSEHFRLRHFLPKDQPNVWPKYLVLDTRLVDKLELVLEELRREGVNTRGVRVMSGFRTPQYNVGVGDTRGRASLSRHMYGDAADIYIDNNGDGQMDDINGDGRVDVQDAEMIRRAAERVEARHPDLIGGIGVYRNNPVHGPFVHIDTRGYRARW
jgi:uncharacterized protein YcbK (DUF882 family)